MSKFIQVSQALKSIEQGKFQILCTHYLITTLGGDLHSPGTVEGKEKTRKGRPDIYLLQSDGRYIISECTTKDDSDKKGFEAKLCSDLEGMLDFDGLGIAKEKIRMICICCNSSVDIKLTDELTERAREFGIPLRVIGIFNLATYYSAIGKVFARDFLNIPFETGQILTKTEFLEQYGKRKLATPLDNIIIGRESRLKELVEIIARHQVIILTGQGGVGKSRLAMEAVDLFCAENGPNYCALYIFPKVGAITEDLATFLVPGNSYLLLIDDANRQLENLESILFKVLETDISLKVIITIRDYAKNQIAYYCRDVDARFQVVEGLSEETINQIIAAKPFNISSSRIRQRIVGIAKGNPRLAIMAAKAMKEGGFKSIVWDVTKIYDQYYQTILNDNGILNGKLAQKVLGLVAFFYTLDPQQAEDLEILKNFGITIEEFQSTVEVLENIEILEVYQGSVVKISEQVLSTYYFYNAFFRYHLLDLEVLFNSYFYSHNHRFSDSVVAAIITFGPDNVIGVNKKFWTGQWQLFKGDQRSAIRFLNIFGSYFPNELFVMVNSIISEFDAVDIELWLRNSAKIAPNHGDRDDVLRLLEPFFLNYDNNYQTAIHLSFEYVAKNSNAAAILIDDLKKNLYIRGTDIKNGFARIIFLYDYLKQRIKTAACYRYAFYFVMEHSIIGSSGSYELYLDGYSQNELVESFRLLRNMFLKDLQLNFKIDGDVIFPLLMGYIKEKNRLRFAELKSDSTLLLKIVKNRFDPNDFGHCYWVQHYFEFLEGEGAKLPGASTMLRKKYNCKDYAVYADLVIDYHSKMARKIPYQQFHERRINEIEKAFDFTDITAFSEFYRSLEKICDFDPMLKSEVAEGVDILLQATFRRDIELGFQSLEYYLDQGNINSLYFNRTMRSIFETTKENSHRLLIMINRTEFAYAHIVRQRFFDFLPEDFIETSTISQLLDCYMTTRSGFDLYASSFKKYEAFKSGTTGNILKLLVSRRLRDPAFAYKLGYDFFAESPEVLSNSMNICKKAYFQQETMPGQYDVDSRELFLIIKKQKKFFTEYIDHFLDVHTERYINDNKTLTQVWELKNAETLVAQTIVKIAGISGINRSDHLACIFFYGVDAQYHPTIKKTFEDLTVNYCKNEKVMNVVLDTLRNGMQKYYYQIIKLLLSCNSDFTFFKSLEFNNSHFSSNSGELWSDFKAKELKKVYNTVQSLPEQYRYILHQDYLLKRIAEENDYSEHERKYRFRGFW